VRLIRESNKHGRCIYYKLLFMILQEPLPGIKQPPLPQPSFQPPPNLQAPRLNGMGFFRE
jgi:hypothetical protein